MASSWGKALIQLPLQWDGKKWSVAKTGSKSELRNIQNKDAAGATVFVDADPAVAPLIEAQHQAAISYVKTPIGSTDFRMSTLFADVGDPVRSRSSTRPSRPMWPATSRPICRSTPACPCCR
jgi:2',3'-cyclic-nucleotide 2'-phosphodiesterase/3'-nucleotidase